LLSGGRQADNLLQQAGPRWCRRRTAPEPPGMAATAGPQNGTAADSRAERQRSFALHGPRG
ncbi:TPA: hypothetical protein ACHXFN_005159, partial [Escherichia coli]